MTEVLVTAPPPTDTVDLHFKLVSRTKAVSYDEKFTRANLLAAAPSYGLIFIGVHDGFIVAKANAVNESPFPQKSFHVRCRPVTHLAVNSDETLLLAGGIVKSKGCVIYTYLINNSLSGFQKVEPTLTPNVWICDLAWNPAVPLLLSACLSDGSVVMIEFNENSFELNSLPPAAAARCLCWSPKGKQVVVGGEDGKLIQYKPDLKPAKILPSPPGLFGGAAAVVNVLWVSNFQFAAFYRHRSDPNVSPVLVIVNAFKNEPITFINYDDVTYGSTGFRFPQFYFHHLQSWNMIFVSSANSVELAVLELTADGKNWQQRLVGDSSRVEMPLSDSQDETYPLGMAIDLTSQTPVPWPQAETELPPMPRILFINNEGKLCLYNVVQLRPDLPQICAPPSKQYPEGFFTLPAAPTKKEETPVPEVAPSPQQQVALSPQQQVAPSPSPLQQAAPSPQQQKTPIAQKPSTPFASPILMPQPITLNFPAFQPQILIAPVMETPPKPAQQDSKPTVSTPPKEASPPKESTPKETDTSATQALSPVVESETENEAAVYVAMLWEEVADLNQSLAAFKLEMSSKNIQVDPVEKFSNVVKSLDNLNDFERNVEETTNSQAEEISELKFDVLELTAKLEDTRLLSCRQSNKLTSQLRRSDQLDPVMTRTLREILALKTYIENEFSQINDHLDRQWEEYQRSCRKNAKDMLETPMMEDVFKTMNLQKKLICLKRNQLDSLQKEIEKRSAAARLQPGIANVSQRNINSSRSAELSKLADSLLGMSIKTNDKIDKDDIKCLAVESKRKNLLAQELTAVELTLLLDRFEDAEVPQVSQVLSYAEREAHKKEVAQRIKNTSERIKAKKIQEQNSKKQVVEEKLKPQNDIIRNWMVQSEPTHPSNQTISSSEYQKSSGQSHASMIEAKQFEKPKSTEKTDFFTSVPQETPKVTDNSQSVLGMLLTTSAEPKDMPVETKSPVASAKVTETQKPLIVTPSFGGFGAPKFGSFTPGFVSTTVVSTPLFSTPGTSLFSNALPSFSFGGVSTSAFGGVKTSTTDTTSTNQVSSTGTSDPSDKFETAATTPKIEFSFGEVLKAQAANSSTASSQEKKVESKLTSLFGSSTGTTTQQPIKVLVPPSAKEVEDAQVPSTPASSLLPSPETSQPSTPTNVVSSSSPAVSTSTTPKLSLFGSQTATPANLGLFGTQASTTSVFGAFNTPATTATSLFGSNLGSGLFSSSSASQSVFSSVAASTTSATTTSAQSSAHETTTSSSIFAKTVTTAATSASPFGVSTSASPTISSAFGSSAPLFGSLPTTTTGSLFSATPATTSSGLLSTAPATTSSGLFSTAPVATTSGLFNTVPAATNASLFSTASPTTSAGLFSAAPASTTGSLFSSTPATTTASLFSVAPVSTTTSSSLFTTPLFAPTTTSAAMFGSSFGGLSTTTTSSGLFGSVTTPTTQASFGADLNQTTNLFGQLLEGSPSAKPAANLFSQEAPKKTGFDSGGSIFSTNTPANTSSSIFGSSSPSAFGQAPSSGGLFGSPATTTNIFAQTPATTSSSFFGQNICSPFAPSTPAPNQSPFASPATTSQSVFANSAPVFGQNTFGQTNTSSIFGAGSGTSSGSIFGGNTTGSFQSSFSGGPFSGGTGSVAQSGFGAPAAFSKPPASGFGSAPVFGGAPAVAPTFGGSPAFGSTSPFSSPTKVFGSTSPQAPVFGQSTGTTGFETLGNQNTVGFGNIAQQGFSSTGFGSPQPSAFGTQPQQTSSFGSSSFSSWR